MGVANQYMVNLFAQGLGRMGTFAANFFVFILIARIGGTDFFGRYSYLITFLGLFVGIADFGMTSALGRDLPRVQGSPGIYWGNFLMLRGLFNGATIVMAVIAAYFMRRDLFVILFVGSLFLPILSARFFEPVFQVFRRPWYSTYSSLAYAVIFPVLSFLAIRSSLSLYTVAAAFFLSNTAYAVIAFRLAHKAIRPVFEIDRSVLGGISRVAVPLGVSGLFTIVSSRVAVFMLASMQSDYAVGVFSAAYRFFEISAMMAVMVTGPFIPIFAAKMLEDPGVLRRISLEVFELAGVLGIPVAIVFPFVSTTLILTLFGNSFAPSIGVLNIMIWACVLVFISLFTASVAIAMGVVHFAYWNTASAALLAIILNYFLIPGHSFIGSAWAIVICEIFLSGVSTCYVIKNIGNFFRLSVWLKIAGVNALLYLMLNNHIFELNATVKVLISLCIYGLLVIVFKLISRETLMRFYRMLSPGLGTGS